MAAAIAAIAAGTVATFWFGTQAITPAPSAVEGPALSAVERPVVERRPVAPVLQAPALAGSSVVSEAVGGPSTAARGVKVRRHRQPPLVVTNAVAFDLPEVLAPPDQGIALRRLLVSRRAGRGAVPPPQVSSAIESLPELEALAITPLTIEPLDRGSSGQGGKDRD